MHVGNHRPEFQQAPKYLGVRLDRTLSYKQHLDEVKAKTTARISLIRRLAGSTWGASPQTLPALVLPVAEYCDPAWRRSPHVNKVNTVINGALRIVTVLPACPSWNFPSQSQTGCSYPSPGRKSPGVRLAHPAQSHNTGTTRQAQVSPSLLQGSTRDATVGS